MKKVLLAIALTGLLASCTHVQSGSVVEGHPYRTDPSCDRSVPYGQFDSKCDYPLVGYKGFSDPTIVPGVGSSGGGGFF